VQQSWNGLPQPKNSKPPRVTPYPKNECFAGAFSTIAAPAAKSDVIGLSFSAPARRFGARNRSPP
jgi:hypothetical protein